MARPSQRLCSHTHSGHRRKPKSSSGDPLGASKHSWSCGVDPTESNGAPAREVTGIRDQSGGMASWAVDKHKQLKPSSRRILFVRPDKWTGEMGPNWPPCCCIRLLWPWRARCWIVKCTFCAVLGLMQSVSYVRSKKRTRTFWCLCSSNAAI